MRKRRTREHVIADLSVNFVERQALLCGYTVERIVHDYGIDLEIFVFNQRGEIQEGKILVQLKATARVRIEPGKRFFSFRVARSDLVLWLAQPMPVALIVYDAARDLAYWLYVQNYFAKRKNFNLFAAGKQVAVHIPVQQTVNPKAMRKLARFRKRVLEQMRDEIHEQD
ncbi:MAG: DUF4365 domain-containing protein [Gemmataceae bacterium]|nr:DUF4365 domain-containing protein [Gemmataceae bacterium]MCI0741415.1 DUF4365 domain-containing protein [Gemmataceae bacterium]